jgi:hypothetical protein
MDSHASFTDVFASCGFDKEVALSEFCTEINADALRGEEEEPSQQRRPTRKREEPRRELEEEPLYRRKKGNKSTEKTIEEVVLPPEPIDTKGLKKRKRGAVVEGGSEPVIEPREGSEELPIKPLVVEYEPLVAQFVEYGENYMEDAVVVPFLRFADHWLRLLHVLQRRLLEVGMWELSLRQLHEATQTGVHASEEGRLLFDIEVSRLSAWADQRCIYSHRCVELGDVVRHIVEWTRTADDMLAGRQLLGLDPLRDFISTGEGFGVYMVQLDVLRQQHKRGRAWFAKYQKVTADKKGARMDDLEALMAESEELRVDLEEFTNQIVLDNKKYCLCRQGYHMEMVGCDECDEWYHFLCIGMSQAQADKCDKYLCVRCSLRASFLNAVVLAAQTINRWMNPVEISRAREMKLSKASKRAGREEKDILRIQSELNRIVLMAKQRHEAEALVQASALSSLDGTLIVPTPFSLQALVNEGSEVGNLIRKYSFELEALKTSVRKGQADERDLVTHSLHEQNKQAEIVEWMGLIREILWPTSPQSQLLGAPQKSGELPEGVRRAAFEAERGDISKVEEVVSVIQCFLWMGWCFRCLSSLRGPISTQELRKLVNASRSIKFYDDRIVKTLINILTRSKYGMHICIIIQM